jgi:TPR repeat protein
MVDDGDPGAVALLASWLAKGEKGLAKDEAKARTLYTQAAKSGSAYAIGRLACGHLTGNDCMELNHSLALRWAAAGAALGDGTSMVALGTLYCRGHAGLPTDKDEGFQLYLRGIERLGKYGNSSMMVHLGRMYENGEGTVCDTYKAAEWMRKAVAINFPAGSSAVQAARDWLAARGLEVEFRSSRSERRCRED